MDDVLLTGTLSYSKNSNFEKFAKPETSLKDYSTDQYNQNKVIKHVTIFRLGMENAKGSGYPAW